MHAPHWSRGMNWQRDPSSDIRAWMLKTIITILPHSWNRCRGIMCLTLASPSFFNSLLGKKPTPGDSSRDLFIPKTLEVTNNLLKKSHLYHLERIDGATPISLGFIMAPLRKIHLFGSGNAPSTDSPIGVTIPRTSWAELLRLWAGHFHASCREIVCLRSWEKRLVVLIP